MKHLVVFTFKRDVEPLDSLVTYLPYSGDIIDIQVNAPCATKELELHLETSSDLINWLPILGTELDLLVTNRLPRKIVDTPVIASYVRVRASEDSPFGIVYQFVVEER